MPFRYTCAVGLGLWLGALTACGGDSGDDTAHEQAPPHHLTATPAVETPPPTPQPPAARPEPQLFRRSQTMMGTIIQITVLAPEDDAHEQAVRAAFAEMRRLEGVLSEWQPDSEISQINAAAGKKPVAVSDDTLAVVRAGVEVSRWSEGAFDLTWAALRGLYLFQPGSETVPTAAELKPRLKRIDYRQIVIDEDKKTVFLRRPDMVIGTGGIAKGYALDRAGAVLQAAGITNYMLFGGGQVQVRGLKGDRLWRVGIQHPRKDDYFGYLAVDGGSISTSGDYEHAFIQDGKRWHHLLDLKTGLPVEHTTSVTVLADSGLYADALSTAIFAMGYERAGARLAAAPGRPRFVTVDNQLVVHVGGDLPADRLVLSPGVAREKALPQ